MDSFRSQENIQCPVWLIFVGILILALIFIIFQLWYVFFANLVECILGQPPSLLASFVIALILTLLFAFLITWLINQLIIYSD